MHSETKDKEIGENNKYVITYIDNYEEQDNFLEYINEVANKEDNER